MTTAADLIKGAMRDIAMLESGETPSAEEYADGLEALNDLLDGWSADGILIPYHTVDTLTLAAAASSYTIGTGATLDTVRPIEIVTALIRRDGTDHTLRTMTRAQYDAICDKDESAIPGKYYYEPAYANGRIYFDYQPSVNDVLEIASLKPLSSFATTATEASLPPGYKRMIRSNLAVEIAGGFGRGNNIPSTVVATASDSLRAISKRNFINRIPTLSIDSALQSTKYNINHD